MKSLRLMTTMLLLAVFGMVSAQTVVFKETFDKTTGTGGNDGIWSGISAQGDIQYDGAEWTLTNPKGGDKCITVGANKKGGTAITPEINLTGNGTLTFKAGAWEKDKTGLKLSVNNAELDQTQITLTKGAFTDYTVQITNATAPIQITFESAVPSKNRFFLDEVVVTSASETPETNITLTIGQSKYASLYYENQALVVPQGVEAYTYKLNGDKVEESYMYDAGETIPAGTAVILKGEPNDYSFAFSTETGDVDSENILMGTDSDTQLEADANSYFYKLSLNAAEELSSIGFYWGATDGAAFTNKAHKAYLKVAKSSGAKFYRLDGETTAIENVQAAQPDANAPMYNVAGQRVSKNYKGVVIQNGRKYVVK